LAVGAAALFALVCVRIVGERVPWQLGQRAPRDIRAHAFTTYADSEATEQKRAEARASTAPIFQPRIAAAARETEDAIASIFALTRNVRLDEKTPISRSLKLRDVLRVKLSEDTRRTLSTITDAELAVAIDMARRLATERMGEEVRDREADLQKARDLVKSAAADLNEPAPLVDAAVEIAQQTIRANIYYDA